jgi:hypothetical protein
MESPRTLLAGRYRFVGAFEPSGSTPRWLALDERSSRPAVVTVVPPHEVAGYLALKGEKHPHLATVVDVLQAVDPVELPDGPLRPEGAAAVVSEYLQGRTLYQVLEEDGPLLPVKAVAWVLRLVSAVQLLRERGLVHGAISPRSIVAEPRHRVIAPVLAHFVAPPVGCYLTPECLKGGAPTPEDDAWALHAVLYAMLVGRAPFRARSRDELVKHVLAGSAQPLGDQGLREPRLQELLNQGLQPNRRQRTVALEHLVRVLDAWERGVQPPRAPLELARGRVAASDRAALAAEHATRWQAEIVFDESAVPDDNGVPPLPEPAPHSVPAWSSPASARPSVPVAAPPPATNPAPAVPSAVATPMLGVRPLTVAPRPRDRWIWVGASLLAAGAVGAVLVAVFQDAPAPSVTVAPPLQLTGPAPSSAASSRPAVVMGPVEERAACIRSYFDREAFPDDPKLEFLCGDDDFRDVTRKLHALAFPVTGGDAGADAGGAAEVQDGGLLVVRASGRNEGQQLGWYELVTAAVIRKSCCAQATSITLPRTRGNCLQLQTIVRSIAEASQNVGDVTHAAREFEDAVTCLFSSNLDRPYAYDTLPTDDNRRAFQRFLQHAAESEAKRATTRR